MQERTYQALLKKELRRRFPGCFILKNDSAALQGIPDLLVLYRDHWAMLEVKVSANAPEQPNQGHYIEKFDAMSFGAFIYPENEKEVLDDLQRAFEVKRSTRVPRRQ